MVVLGNMGSMLRKRLLRQNQAQEGRSIMGVTGVRENGKEDPKAWR